MPLGSGELSCAFDHDRCVVLDEPSGLNRDDVVGTDIFESQPAVLPLVLALLPARHRVSEQAVDVAEEDLVRGDFLAEPRSVPPELASTCRSELVFEGSQLSDDVVVFPVVHLRERENDVPQSAVMPGRRDAEEGCDG